MNILVITQYFWPENFLINDLALGLLDRGHKVTVLTGIPNYPKGVVFNGYGYFNKKENYHGVKILRVPLVPRGKAGGVMLSLNYLTYALSACIAGPLLCRGKFDCIFSFEPSPITVGIPALVFKALKAAPVFFWVQDLWPESLAAAGGFKSKKLLAVIEKLVRFIYKKSDRILIQSRAFFDSVVQRGGDSNHIYYFPNSAENVFIRRMGIKKKLPLSNGFKILFAGNIGAAQDFATIIAAAEILIGYKDIHWIIVGDGRMKEWAEAEVENAGLGGNFHFLGRHPLETMPSIFSQSDALLVTLKKDPIFALTIPTKIQSYLANGSPIVAAMDGEGAKIVSDAGAGFVCPAESPLELSRIVLKMYATPKSDRETMGKNGRRYYERNFDREMLIDKLDSWMKDLCGE